MAAQCPECESEDVELVDEEGGEFECAECGASFFEDDLIDDEDEDLAVDDDDDE